MIKNLSFKIQIPSICPMPAVSWDTKSAWISKIVPTNGNTAKPRTPNWKWNERTARQESLRREVYCLHHGVTGRPARVRRTWTGFKKETMHLLFFAVASAVDVARSSDPSLCRIAVCKPGGERSMDRGSSAVSGANVPKSSHWLQSWRLRRLGCRTIRGGRH